MYCIDIDLSDVIQAQEQVTFKEHMLETIFQSNTRFVLLDGK